jgi:hypothetical protein
MDSEAFETVYPSVVDRDVRILAAAKLEPQT